MNPATGGPGKSATSSNRRRSTAARNNRRHTLAVNPSREPMSIPSGQSNVIQFLPLRQALSARARRAIRRNALSEEMNNIESEERVGRKRSREEIAKLRAELDARSRRLEELEQLLAAVRHAPLEEPEQHPLPAVPEEFEDEEMGGMGFGYDGGHEDDTPEPEPFSPMSPLGGSSTPRPILSRRQSFSDTPGSRKKDERIQQLEKEILALREEHQLQLEVIRQAEEEETYHDAQEQVLQDENISLQEKNDRLNQRVEELQQLRDERAAQRAAKRVTFAETAVVERSPAVDEDDYMELVASDLEDASSEDTTFGLPISSGVDSGIGASQEPTMEIVVEQDERIDELEMVNDKLQDKLEALQIKMQDLQDEVEDVRLDSEATRDKAYLLAQENEVLQKLSDNLTSRIRELEEIEGLRLENVSNGGVQTELITDEDKISLAQQVDGHLEAAQELQAMYNTISKEKHDADNAIVECQARISALEAAVEAGSQEKTAAITLADQLRQIVADLEGRSKGLELEKEDMRLEIEELCEKCARLEKALEGLQSENSYLQSQMDAKESKITQLNEEMSAALCRVASFEKDINDLHAEVTRLRVQVAERDDRIQTLEEGKSALEEAAESLETDNSSLQVQITNSNKEIASLKAVEETHSDEIDELNSKLLDLEDVNETLQRANESLQDEKATLESKIDDLEDTKYEAIDENTNLQSKIDDLETQIEALEDRADTAEDAKEEFEATISNMTTQIKALENAADGSKKEIESYKRDIARLRTEVEQLEAELGHTGTESEERQQAILETKAQVKAFVQAEHAAAEVKEQLDIQLAGLAAQVEALQKAGHKAQKEKEDLESQVAKLNAEVENLEDEVEALAAEKNLMQHDIDGYKARIESLDQLLEVANRDKDVMARTIADLELKLVSLESNLTKSHSDNSSLCTEIKALTEKIEVLKREAESDREEKSIIADKIRPYFAGEQSLDMAIDEVLTELVMARNHADEEKHRRVQLEKKIKLLAQNNKGIEAEEALDRLADRFKDVRKRVENLYLQWRQDKESPFGDHNLEDFAWTGSNEHALEMLGEVVEDLSVRVVDTQRTAQALKSSLDTERVQAGDLESYLEDVVMAVGDDVISPEKANVSAIVKGRVVELNARIESLEEQLDAFAAAINKKNKTIQNMEVDLDAAAERETQLSRNLVLQTGAAETANGHLERARGEIEELNTAMERRVREIEHLEQVLEDGQEEERILQKKIEDQIATHQATIQQLEQKRLDSLNAMEDEMEDLTEANEGIVAGLNNALAERHAEINGLQSSLAASESEVARLNARLQQVQSTNEATIGQLHRKLGESQASKEALAQDFREKVYDRDHTIEKLQIQLREARDDASERIVELEDAIRNSKDTTLSLSNKLGDSIKRVQEIEGQLQLVRQTNEVQKQQYKVALDAIASELDKVRVAALAEKQSLLDEIDAGQVQIKENEDRVAVLMRLLDEAEESEGQLEEDLKNERAEHQITAEAAERNREVLASEKEALQAQLVTARRTAAAVETEHRKNIDALNELTNEKNAQIEELNTRVTALTHEKNAMATQVTDLIKENADLMEENVIERQRGTEAVQNLFAETQKHIARMGDIKGLYVRETTTRASASKKRSRTEAEVEEELAQAPPTPTGTIARRMNAVQQLMRREGGMSKRRRNDSGIGVGLEEEDEGFEGSLASGSMAGA